MLCQGGGGSGFGVLSVERAEVPVDEPEPEREQMSPAASNKASTSSIFYGKKIRGTINSLALHSAGDN